MKFKNKIIAILFIIVILFVLIIISFIIITYSNPIIYGDNFPSEKLENDCHRYSQTLVGEVFGIPLHAQLIYVKNTSDEKGNISCEFFLISLFPPAATHVWALETDVPYWESGLEAWGDFWS